MFSNFEARKRLNLFSINLLAAIQLAFPWFKNSYKDLLDEIDKLEREWSKNCDKETGRSYFHVDSTSLAEKEDIINKLYRIENERLQFLNNFPRWKPFRLQNIDNMEEIASELEKKFAWNDRVNFVATFCGVFAVAVSGVVTPVVVAFASAANGLSRCYTSIKETHFLQQYIDKSKKVIESDRVIFEQMLTLFKYNIDFLKYVESAIGSDAYKYIFEKLKSSFDKKSENKEYIKNCLSEFIQIISKDNPNLCKDNKISLAFAFLRILVVLSSPILDLQWFEVAASISRVKSYSFATLNLGHALNNANALPATIANFVQYFESILNIGPALWDLLQVGEPHEQVVKIREIANILHNEMVDIETIYNSMKDYQSQSSLSYYIKVIITFMLFHIIYFYFFSWSSYNIFYLVGVGFVSYYIPKISGVIGNLS